MRESAAAWGAALNLIPSLGPVVENYLKTEEGKRLAKAIKDSQQQEFFIQAWQQSSVFKAFFGDEAGQDNGAEGDSSVTQQPAPPSLASLESPLVKPDLALQHHVPTPSPSHDGAKMTHKSSGSDSGFPSLSLSDIVAKDAARSWVQDIIHRETSLTFFRSLSFSQTLGSLGFAPDETLDDFLAMSFNPDPVEEQPRADPSLGTEMDQKAYYELLMGKRFT